MKEEYEVIVDLFLGRRFETENDEDRAALDAWLALSKGNKKLLDDFLDDDKMIKEVRLLNQGDWKASWNRLAQRFPELQDAEMYKEPPHDNENFRHAMIFRWYWPIAAAVILLFAIAVVLLWPGQTPGRHRIPAAASSGLSATRMGAANDRPFLRPADFKAILLLADSSRIELDNHKEGPVAYQGNMQIIQSAKGELYYKNLDTDPGAEKERTLLYNELSTPRGGHYRIILPDSSIVWLNASSSLRYPAAFSKEVRNVELRGEAYFEVKSQYARNREKIPFIVHVLTPLPPGGISDGHDARFVVQGTSFNLRSYADDHYLMATLVDGAISVRQSDRSRAQQQLRPRTVFMKPRQRYIRYANGTDSLLDLQDLKEDLAWKNQEFRFDNQPIGEIVRQMERWYDAKIICRQDSFPGNYTLLGSRTEPADSLLHRLEELNTGIHYDIQDNRIILSSH